jgi:hypothetical protein
MLLLLERCFIVCYVNVLLDVCYVCVCVTAENATSISWYAKYVLLLYFIVSCLPLIQRMSI